VVGLERAPREKPSASPVRLSLLQGRVAGGARPDLAVLPALAAAPGRQLHGRAARPPVPAAAGHPGPTQGAGVHLPPPGAAGNPLPWGRWNPLWEGKGSPLGIMSDLLP